MANNDGLLNLFLNVPDEIRAKLTKFSQNDQIEKGKVELTVLYSTNVDKVRRAVSNLGGTLDDLGFGFGIVTVNVGDVLKLASIPEIQYIELPKTLYTSYLPANQAACIREAQQVYNLTGEGVLVGFIDSGIDYTHPAFIDDNGNTRIEYICDFSRGGKVWSKKDINNALKSPNPLSIVSETDEIGHGTHVAGIACAGGKINKVDYGAAYKSSIMMVKMTPPGKVSYAKSTQLMRGIRFLIDRASELKMPLVINLSFSTNDGAHDGQSLLEQYISTISSLERISFVIAAGNEGDAAHHIGGQLKSQQNISVNVGNETALILQLYKNLTDNISIEIKDPSGKSSGIIKIDEGYKSGNAGTDKYFIYYSGPKPFSLNGEIIVSLVAAGEFMVVGPWVVTIYLDGGTGGHYDIWMPVSEGLDKSTKFLQPNPFNTLGIPATAGYVISVGSYNYVTNTISTFSGRGRENNVYVKPDLVAPGENIESSIPGGGFDVLSGTSMAAPMVAGACALFMEWGLVKGNDPFLYGDRLRYYILKAAKRDRTGVNYPDPEWGYGTLCLRQAIELARNKGRLTTFSQEGGNFMSNTITNTPNNSTGVNAQLPQNQSNNKIQTQNQGQVQGAGNQSVQSGSSPVKTNSAMSNTTGMAPSSAGISPSPVGTAPSSAGLASNTAGAAPNQTGVVSGQAVVAPNQAGSALGSVGAVPNHIGAVSSPAGAIPNQAGVVPSPSGAVPNQTGVAPGSTVAVPNPKVAVPSPSVSQVPPSTAPQVAQPAVGTCGELYINENYEAFIVEYDGNIVEAFKKIPNACAFILDENYAIVSIEKSRVQELLKVKEIVYVQEPIIYTLGAISPLESANIDKFHNNPYLTLTGNGVLAGLVDTGIDYMNSEFMYEDDTTKILSLWDQTGTSGKSPSGFDFGTQYSSDDINRAIKLGKSGGDPYTIVNSRDEIGHGTSMAGIIAGRGRNPQLTGAAPDAQIVAVKLKQAKGSSLQDLGILEPKVPVYLNTDVVLAIKYLFNVARQLNKPIVIYVPLGTNSGGHDGSTILERYIDSISEVRGLAVVTGTGNEGDADIHTSGKIDKTGDTKTIELKVDETERDITFSIWVNRPDKVSIGITSPSGEVIDKVPAKLRQTEEIKFVFEGSNVSVTYYLPEEITGDEQIKIRLKNVRSGIWQFKLIGDYIVDGTYNAWLPQRGLLKENTRFLNPSQYITLTTPATSRRVIASADYNQDNNTVISTSGRGYTRDGRIKPIIAAGGYNVLTTSPGGEVTTVSGSSAGAAVTAGAVILMMEWGIVDGNDPTLYSNKINTYLARGAAKRPGDIYPNQQWGFGMLDLNNVFINMRSAEEENNKVEKRKKSSVYIRMPDEIKRYLGIK